MKLLTQISFKLVIPVESVLEIFYTFRDDNIVHVDDQDNGAFGNIVNISTQRTQIYPI
jgi:hypothetical protein